MVRIVENHPNAAYFRQTNAGGRLTYTPSPIPNGHWQNYAVQALLTSMGYKAVIMAQNITALAIPFRGDYVFDVFRIELTPDSVDRHELHHDTETVLLLESYIRRNVVPFPPVTLLCKDAEGYFKTPVVLKSKEDAEEFIAAWTEFEARHLALHGRLWQGIQPHIAKMDALFKSAGPGAYSSIQAEVGKAWSSAEAWVNEITGNYKKHFNDPRLLVAIDPIEGLTLSATVSRASAHDWGVSLTKSQGGACTLKLHSIVSSDGLTEIPAANIDTLTTKEYTLTSENARSASLRLKLTGITGPGTWYAWYDCIHPDGPQSRAEVKVTLTEPEPEAEE